MADCCSRPESWFAFCHEATKSITIVLSLDGVPVHRRFKPASWQLSLAVTRYPVTLVDREAFEAVSVKVYTTANRDQPSGDPR